MRVLVKLSRRLRLMVARRAVEREMAEEFRSHLEEEIRLLEGQGLSSAEAQRRAAIAFGGGERVKEEARDQRGGRWLDDLRADLYYGLRQVRRSPGHAAAIVGILGTAIAAVSVALALASGYLLRPLPIPHPERLVAVLAGPSRVPLLNPPDLRTVDWAGAGAFFEETVAWDLDGFTIVGGAGAPESVDGSWVSPGFFRALGIVPALGRGFEPAEYVPGANVALISDRLWRRRFGADSNVIGRSIRAHSTDRPEEDALVTIMGVLPPIPWEVHRFTDMLRPLGTPRFFSLARLPEGMSVADAAARLTTAVRAQAKTDSTWRMTLVSAQDDYVASIRLVLTTVVAAAILLVLLAQASVGALLVARGTGRGHELIIRRALGATVPRLLRQFLVEAGLLLAAALAIGFASAPLLIAGVGRMIETFGRVAVPGGVSSVKLDFGISATVGLVVAIPFVVFAMLPLLGLLRIVTPATGSLHRSSPSVRMVRTRRALAAVQVAVAVALLTPGLMLTKSVRAMLGTELGFRPEGILKGFLLLPQPLYSDSISRVLVMDRVLQRVRQVPGVVAASAIDRPPFHGTSFVPVECEGCPADLQSLTLADPQTVTSGYWETTGIQLVAGRAFDERDVMTAPPVAVVSERLAARMWPHRDAVGQRIRTNRGEPGPWLTVVGVAAEVRKTYSDSLYPDLYRSNAQAGRRYLALLIRTAGAPAQFARPIREAVAAEHESLALSEVEPLTDMLAARRGRTGILAWLVSGVAVLALGLTGFGLYAVIGYLVQLRRREFAIRAALGAQRSAVVGAVWRDTSGMLVAGLGIGVAVATGATGLIGSFLVGVGRGDPWVLTGVVGVVVGLVALAAAPAAARIVAQNPAVVLREE